MRTEHDTWRTFNDAVVKQTTWNQIDGTMNISREAYVLLYRRRTEDNQAQFAGQLLILNFMYILQSICSLFVSTSLISRTSIL